MDQKRASNGDLEGFKRTKYNIKIHDSVPTAGQTLVIFKKVVLEMSAETFFCNL